MHKPVNEKFYSDGQEYWSTIPPTIDGMLGGFGHVSHIDIQGSKVFLQQVFRSKNPPGRTHAADCGAGIGRISKHLLLNFFDNVDLVEQNSKFLDSAKDYLGPKLFPKIGKLYNVGLQDFKPESNKYDVIWVQWVLGHLTDTDFVQFFENCGKSLKPNGMIIVKENITSQGIIEIDNRDSSVTRPLEVLKTLFKKADLECYRQMKQHPFPKELYKVYMFALKPKTVLPVLVIDNLKTTDASTQPESEIQFVSCSGDNSASASVTNNEIEREDPLNIRSDKYESNIPDEK